MFEFKIDGVLEIGSSGIKVMISKNRKIDYVNYTNMNEEKLIVLQEALELLSKRVKLKGKNFIVTIPAPKFYIKSLEYENLEDGETLEEKVESDLEEIVSGYSKEGFITKMEVIPGTKDKNKVLAVTIPVEEIEKILTILESFKMRVLKVMPDFTALSNIVNLIIQENKKSENIDNIAIVDIGGNSTKVLMSIKGAVNMVRIIGIGGNDFTEIIGEHEMLTYDDAELEKYRLELGEEETKVYKNQTEVTMFKELTDMVKKLMSQIENSVKYFNTNISDGTIGKVYLTGGGGELNGFDRYFHKEFQIPCEKIDVKSLDIESKKSKQDNYILNSRMAALVGTLVKRGEKSNEKYEFFNK